MSKKEQARHAYAKKLKRMCISKEIQALPQVICNPRIDLPNLAGKCGNCCSILCAGSGHCYSKTNHIKFHMLSLGAPVLPRNLSTVHNVETAVFLIQFLVSNLEI